MAKQPPASYVTNLLSELRLIHEEFEEVLAVSRIESTNLPSNFIGFPGYRWVDSDTQLEGARMALLGRVRGWEPRYRLLFPHPTPQVTERLDTHIGRLEGWLVRDGGDHSLPPNIATAVEMVKESVQQLQELSQMLPPDEYEKRVTVDTNTLIDNPDLAQFTGQIGGRYMAHLLPVVLREIDELKRSGRTQEVREGAWKADRRLKGLRNNGNVLTGARVAGDVLAKFENIEPRSDLLPSWLDLDVPDDRFVASTLLLQSKHPGSVLYPATSDINLQTKLAAVGLPFIEP